MALHDTAASLWRARVEDVLITGELRYRIPKSNARVAKTRAQGRIFKGFAGKAASTQDFLESLARATREICHASAAGVSVLERPLHGAPMFRWGAVCGVLAHHAGETFPNWSPSGATLERKSPQLFLYPARCFNYLNQLTPAIIESLVVPIFVAERPWGTLWAVSHEEHRNFDCTDVDALSSLAELAADTLRRLPAAANLVPGI
ncbi:MAG TPA: GAF domain-containing protein [Terriglobales bacterium]|nr:GAF domain-containing protein [Terriglobales bacterium]